jgi:transposase-like protein
VAVVTRLALLRQESVRAAAKRYGISPTTLQKWRSRQTSTDARMGPKEPRSSVLSLEDTVSVVVALPWRTCPIARPSRRHQS